MIRVFSKCCGKRYEHEDITLINITQLVDTVDPFSGNNRMRKLATTIEDSVPPIKSAKWVDIYSLDKITEHNVPDGGIVFNVMIHHGGKDNDINFNIIMGFNVFNRIKLNLPTNENTYNYRYHINRSKKDVWYVTLEISR